MPLVASGANRPLLPKAAPTTPALSSAGAPAPGRPEGTTAVGPARARPSVIVMLSCAAETVTHQAQAAATTPSSVQLRRRCEAIRSFDSLCITTPTVQVTCELVLP